MVRTSKSSNGCLKKIWFCHNVYEIILAISLFFLYFLGPSGTQKLKKGLWYLSNFEEIDLA